jgi:hypothetical protein
LPPVVQPALDAAPPCCGERFGPRGQRSAPGLANNKEDIHMITRHKFTLCLQLVVAILMLLSTVPGSADMLPS